MSDFVEQRSGGEARSYSMGWRVLTCQSGPTWLSFQIEPMKAAPCRVYVPSERSWRMHAPAWAQDARATILAEAKQIPWNRDLDWIESDQTSFWLRHVNDPPKGSLESTEGGRSLERQRMFHPEASRNFSKDDCKQQWIAAAEKMALAASGRVTIDANEMVPGSVFQEVELPALRRNPRVTVHFVNCDRSWPPPFPGPEKQPGPEIRRRTSVVVVALALVLFGFILLAAVLTMVENLHNGASGRRWAFTTGVTGAAALAIYALLGDLLSRFDMRPPSDGSAGSSAKSG